MISEFGPVNPFPGLRPFDASEAHLFFGRGEQVDGLIAKLATSRFVAVMGASGSGKSSLVAAGLLPALHGGFSVDVGSHWRIAGMRPGRNPIHNLAWSLAGLHEHPDPPTKLTAEAAGMEATLRRSSLGLIELAGGNGLDVDGRLLVLVDQFEELFRFRGKTVDEARRQEAASFVQLLIEAARDDDAPIDVVMTMRSDFLGDCSQFRELPETINQGLFLVPRLSRSQLRQAITGPAAVAGGGFAPRLVQRLLNDAGADPDVLPVLQHALMRSWDLWVDDTGATGLIDLVHYERAGGLETALARHADQAYFELEGARPQSVAELMFKRLTELGPDRREVRRPTPLAEIAEVAEATTDEVMDIIGHFERHGRSFLTVSADGIVDISHESLIRQWPRLREWTVQEAESGDVYLRLVDAAERWNRGEAALLRNPDLQIAATWWEENRPNASWADRYKPRFGLAASYLDRSRRSARRRRVLAAAAIAVLVILTVTSTALALVARDQRDKAETATATALTGQLAAQSMSRLHERRPWQVLTALEAMRLSEENGLRVPAVEEALREALRDPVGVRLPASTARAGHDRSVRALAFSPDGFLLATAGEDSRILLWAVDDPEADPTELGSHDGTVNAVAFDPDGRWLATGSDDGTARLWDLSDWSRDPIPLTDHAGGILALAFSPDGNWLATAGTDKTARLWSVDDPGRPPRVLPHDGIVESLAFSPDSSLLLTGDGGTNRGRIWDVDDPGADPTILPGHTKKIVAVDFAPDGKRAATASLDRTVRVWDVERRSEPPQVHRHGGSVRTVEFSDDGRWLATGSDDRTARVWDLDADPTGASVRIIEHSGEVRKLRFDPDGHWLATGSGNNVVTVHDLDAPGSEAVYLSGHEGAIRGLDFSADGRWLATGSDDATARLWDLDQLTTRPTVIEEEDDVADLAFSPDGRYLLAGFEDRIAMHLRELDDPSSPTLFEDDPADGSPDAGVTTVAFNPEGDLIAAGSGDEMVRVWDRDQSAGPAPRTLRTEGRVSALAFSPDGRWLASGTTEKLIRLWDAANWTERDLGAVDSQVAGLAFSPGGTWLAAETWGRNVLLWRLDDLDSDPTPLEFDVDRPTAIAFSSDDGRLAGAGDRTVTIWSLGGDSPMVENVLTTDDGVTDLAFSPDRELLIVAAGRFVQLWDLAVADPAAPTVNPVVLTGHDDDVRAVATDADGRWFASADSGGTVLVWSPLDGLVTMACDVAGRNLTADEWRTLFGEEPYRTTCDDFPEGR